MSCTGTRFLIIMSFACWSRLRRFYSFEQHDAVISIVRAFYHSNWPRLSAGRRLANSRKTPNECFRFDFASRAL